MLHQPNPSIVGPSAGHHAQQRDSAVTCWELGMIGSWDDWLARFGWIDICCFDASLSFGLLTLVFSLHYTCLWYTESPRLRVNHTERVYAYK